MTLLATLPALICKFLKLAVAAVVAFWKTPVPETVVLPKPPVIIPIPNIKGVVVNWVNVPLFTKAEPMYNWLAVVWRNSEPEFTVNVPLTCNPYEPAVVLDSACLFTVFPPFTIKFCRGT